MEFLVRINILWPPEESTEKRERIFVDELQQGKRLAAEGKLRRIWRVPGRWANWSLYDVNDATELHAALSSLPLYPWMDIEVHPLADHPNDPSESQHLQAGQIGEADAATRNDTDPSER